jgi:hypothetical protein
MDDDYMQGKEFAFFLNKYKFTKYDIFRIVILLIAIFTLLIFVKISNVSLVRLNTIFMYLFVVIVIVAEQLLLYSKIKLLIKDGGDKYFNGSIIKYWLLLTDPYIYGSLTLNKKFYKGFVENYWLTTFFYIIMIIIFLPFGLFATYIVINLILSLIKG